jgi:hypothetical protein
MYTGEGTILLRELAATPAAENRDTATLAGQAHDERRSVFVPRVMQAGKQSIRAVPLGSGCGRKLEGSVAVVEEQGATRIRSNGLTKLVEDPRQARPSCVRHGAIAHDARARDGARNLPLWALPPPPASASCAR